MSHPTITYPILKKINCTNAFKLIYKVSYKTKAVETLHGTSDYMELIR